MVLDNAVRGAAGCALAIITRAEQLHRSHLDRAQRHGCSLKTNMPSGMLTRQAFQDIGPEAHLTWSMLSHRYASVRMSDSSLLLPSPLHTPHCLA